MQESADPSPTPPRYEFGPDENEVIARTGRWVGWWAWIAMATGVLFLAGGITAWDQGGPAQVAVGAVYVLIGLYFRGAGTSLGRVVRTTGSDVAHLMDALDRLTAAFRIQVILVAVGLVIVVIAIAVTASGGGVPGP